MTRSRNRTRTMSAPMAFILVAVSALAAGCGGLLQSAEAADQAIDSVEVSPTESALLTVAASEASGLAPDAAALTASSKAVVYFMPAGCVTATAMAATGTYNLDKCTGPYGLVQVSGKVTVVFSTTMDGSLQLRATATGLRANQATFD